MIQNLVKIVRDIFYVIIKFIFIISSPIFIYSAFVFVFLFFGILYYRLILKTKKIKCVGSKLKISKFRRLFIDFPKRLVIDFVNKDPNRYTKTGLYMFVGSQGSGKTIAIVDMLIKLRKRYPLLRIRTNMNYKYENGKVSNWQDLIKSHNNEFGQIEVLDEIQTWFSSKDSGNMPAEMFGQICQQRKQSKSIFGSAQCWDKIAKEIRQQVTLVYCPITILGCLTVVRVTKPLYWDNEKMRFKKYLWASTYFFVHSDKIRNAYDTYAIIATMSRIGFSKRNEVFQDGGSLN